MHTRPFFLFLLLLLSFLYASTRRISDSSIGSILFSKNSFQRILPLFPNKGAIQRTSLSAYPTIHFASNQRPYYAANFRLDSKWKSPVFEYANLPNFNYSIVTANKVPSIGQSIYFICDFTLDSASQSYQLVILGDELYFVYLNGYFIAALQYPSEVNQTLSISNSGPFRLAVQVVSPGGRKPFLYVRLVGNRDHSYYLHSTSNPAAWTWSLNDVDDPFGTVNITTAMETRQLYEIGNNGVDFYDSSYHHQRWPIAQPKNFYGVFANEIDAIGPGSNQQPYGTYFVYAPFKVDKSGDYRITLEADDGAYVFLDSQFFTRIISSNNLTSYTVHLNSGTHFIVAQVMNNGQGNLNLVPNGSGVGVTGLVCRIVSTNGAFKPVLKSSSGYLWHILTYPSMILASFLIETIDSTIATKLVSPFVRWFSQQLLSPMTRDKKESISPIFKSFIEWNDFFWSPWGGKSRKRQVPFLISSKELGQKFELDVEISTDLALAGKTDRLEHTINYADVYYLVKHIVEGEPHKLIESVAEDVAKRVLLHYSQARDIRVRVMKPAVAVPGMVKGLGVEIFRTREEYNLVDNSSKFVKTIDSSE
eukprot:jgi/Galph1/5012/GphlegSOOS_G3635.1